MKPRALRHLLPACLVVALSACGEINAELDKANELAGQPMGGQGSAAKAAAREKAQEEQPGEAPEGGAASEILASVKGWIDEATGNAPPPRPGHDPDDPVVSCRLGGSTSWMLKSACLSRSGTVLREKTLGP